MEKEGKDGLTIHQGIVCDRLYKLLLSGDHSDVVVGAGDEQKHFRVYRVILSSASDVFKTMFYGSLPEGIKPVEVPDLQPEGFSTMLRYIYEGKVQFDCVMNTLAVASKYLIRDVCCCYLYHNITAKCACAVYEAACLFEDIKLERAAERSLLFDTDLIIKDESFLSAKHSTVEFIVRQDIIGVPTEWILFDGVLSWAEANIKRKTERKDKTALRNIINPLLPFIDFMSMSAEDFADGPGRSGIFTDEELVSFFMNLLELRVRPLSPWLPNRSERKAFSDVFFVRTFCCYKEHVAFSQVQSIQCTFYAEERMLLRQLLLYTKESLEDEQFPVDLLT